MSFWPSKHLLINRDTRLFWQGVRPYPLWLNNVHIIRLMWGGGADRNGILLSVRLPDIHDFIYRRVGYIDVLNGPCFEPSRYLPGDLVCRIYDMTLKHRWIKQLTAGAADDVQALEVILYLNCKVLWTQKDE